VDIATRTTFKKVLIGILGEVDNQQKGSHSISSSQRRANIRWTDWLCWKNLCKKRKSVLIVRAARHLKRILPRIKNFVSTGYLPEGKTRIPQSADSNPTNY
jgi:hypothetical protein